MSNEKTVEAGENLQVLGQSKKESYAGDFVLQNQTVAKDQGFSHVSKIWADKCMTYDQAVDRVHDDHRKVLDIRGTLQDWRAVVGKNDNLVLEYKDGRQFQPTDYCLTTIGTAAGMGTFFLRQFSEPKYKQGKNEDDGDEAIQYKRDRRDADFLVHALNITLFAPDRTKQDVERLFRCWNDGTMRAMLSKQYATVNNLWMMESMKKLIPGGMVSHFRGNADDMYMNILIPDTIRFDQDSDYGGMLSIGNSEIGRRNVSSVPSVFRAICMNGCIWDQESGIGIKQRHRGEINLEDLYFAIETNLNKQIPLLNTGIERMLRTKMYGCDGVDVTNVVAQVGQDHKLSPAHVKGIIKGMVEEKKSLDCAINTAFAITAGITRYGQTLDNDSWVRMDKVGGAIINMEQPVWRAMVERAGKMSQETKAKIFGQVLAV